MEDQSDGGGPSNQPEAAGTSKETQLEPKVYQDPIHGPMDFHPLLVKIIDTPEFQRLRFIKQLGGAYYVYPGASHNRFEHSLGVAHLAGQLVRSLQKKQPELDIDIRDILCVEIAGLCHDLGHGPFSHLFDKMFIPKVVPGSKWKHEQVSVDMFYHLLNQNNLRSEMRKWGLKVKVEQEEEEEDVDVVFIKEMILGPKVENDQKQFKGRKRNKAFLYEIVANKTNGLDVDKFDYFARDCHYLGLKNNFDHQRFITLARVCDVHGQLQICTRDKELDNIYEMFHTRNRLHRRAYQHKNNKIIELMIAEAIYKALEHPQISELVKQMEENIKNNTSDNMKAYMEAYTKLTDHIFEKILHSSEEKLDKAREILQRVLKRQLYYYLGETKAQEELEITEELWKKELVKALPTYQNDVTENDFEIIVKTIDFGMKEKNPVDNLYFYHKNNLKKAFKMPPEQVSQFLLPKSFSEKWITVYCKSTDRDVQRAAYRHFIQWCENKDFLQPTGPTPAKEEEAEPSKKSKEEEAEPSKKSKEEEAEPSKHPKKVFNDPIHGHMEFHPLLVKIIDTPEFQRLRFIKQMGGVYFVYPGASHNRFEHSLGVAHLAGQLVRSLKKKQPELGINKRDILCVEIAGLCHDLGHGPFSHMFDEMFIPKIKTDGTIKKKHENVSVDMFNHLLEKNNLRSEMRKCGLKVNMEGVQSKDEEEENDVDVVFIEEMIVGPNEEGQCKGRKRNKAFLYEIVANKRNGLDVDKFDYFARDCHNLGIKNNFDHRRLLMFAKVLKDQICYRDKEMANIYDLFHTRSCLHRRACQHDVTGTIHCMFSDVLVKADDFIKKKGKDNEDRKISKAWNDMEAYTKLTDEVFEEILHSEDRNLEGAKALLKDIYSRKLYKHMGWPIKFPNMQRQELEKENLEHEVKKLLTGHLNINEDDLEICFLVTDFGQKEANPINSTNFYDKDGCFVPVKKRKIAENKVPVFVKPEQYIDHRLCVYCKNKEANLKGAYEKVEKLIKVLGMGV